MQRRAELARAMINNPEVMILDEPFRGLDAMTKELMWEYYSRLYEESRRTNFFVTTDIDEAVFLADRLLIMSNIPTQVRAVVEVDLPRPRRLSDIVENDRANEIKRQALSILHAEAMRSFARGSKAAADFVEAYLKRANALSGSVDGDPADPRRSSSGSRSPARCLALRPRCCRRRARSTPSARASSTTPVTCSWELSMLLFVVVGLRGGAA